MESVIPAEAGIQSFKDVLDPGACPGPDPGFAGVTFVATFYEILKLPLPQFYPLPQGKYRFRIKYEAVPFFHFSPIEFSGGLGYGFQPPPKG